MAFGMLKFPFILKFFHVALLPSYDERLGPAQFIFTSTNRFSVIRKYTSVESFLEEGREMMGQRNVLPWQGLHRKLTPGCASSRSNFSSRKIRNLSCWLNILSWMRLPLPPHLLSLCFTTTRFLTEQTPWPMQTVKPLAVTKQITPLSDI